MIRLRTLTEAECYARIYGGWEGTVSVTKAEPRRPRYDLPVSGEDLRASLEARLDARIIDAGITEQEAA